MRAIHHWDLWVDDFETASGEWGWLFGELGWEAGEKGHLWEAPDGTYVFMEHSKDQHGTQDRLRPGVNHIAFMIDDRDQLDRIRAASTEHGWHEMYADRYPHAGGDEHTALYLESSEGFEVEIVLEIEDLTA